MIQKSNDVGGERCPTPPPTNEDLADNLEQVSNSLLAQGANRFRAEAYHRAADSVRKFELPLWQVYHDRGLIGLEEIPGVGRTISRALQQLICGGRWPLLERLRGTHAVEHAFESVPTIGPKLAKRIHEELGIETLAELLDAAWDGRLDRMTGLGEKRVRAIRESLASRGRSLSHKTDLESKFRLVPHHEDLTREVSVDELLDVDDEYRFKAEHRQLPLAAPHRHNPTHEAWLPILHTERFGRHYTALYSNTEHAHAMGTTHDWVVIYLEDHNHPGQQGRWTIITSRFGKLKGHRIVRGREIECEKYYSSRTP